MQLALTKARATPSLVAASAACRLLSPEFQAEESSEGDGKVMTLNRQARDVVAQLVERRPRDPMGAMDRGSNPVRSARKICESFSESKMLC